MKNFILTLSLLVISSLSFSQNQGNRYMFTGKLIASPSNITTCDTDKIAAVFEFEVQMISDNAYTAQNIAIIVVCPAGLGADYLKVGSTYKMELFDDNTDTFTIINESVLDNYSLTYNYYAGDIRRID
ncbi:hypothetical protein K6119_03060 [Paracrocinitomix mangrovi]|uniref:hypothetical protein n=1 Tax=Paracrocinitomix mangrovi TaxID=2862509 RepID=UPI001C8E5016|nr:hypothetical protein [Paracrocinitomix mangrovi]UKN02500.1 hypothetical protein K6119_03060 [Paracrocinitomix mangrovi]